MSGEAERQPRRGRRHYEGEPTGFLPRLAFHYRRKRRKFAAKLITRNLEDTASEAELGLKQWAVLAYFRSLSANHRVLPVAGYGALPGRKIVLAAPSACDVATPSPPGKQTATISARFPAITAHVAEDVEGAPCCSALIAQGRAHIQDCFLHHPVAIVSDHRTVFWHSLEGNAVMQKSQATRHDAGIMLFGWGTYNWYHWLLEGLPAAYLAERLPPEFAGLPLVIPAEIAQLQTFRDSLEVFRQDRAVIVLGSGLHRFDRLVVIDPPVIEPMNLRHGTWPRAGDYAFHRETLLGYRDAIRDRLGIGTGRCDDRIFLARGHGRRSYNQDELLAIAERHGFRAVYPERLSFREQVETLSQSAFVVGPSGAAFANTLFCQPGTRLLSWLVPQYREFCCYTNIATAVGADLRYVFATTERPVKTSYDAFSASYRIDPTEFDTALRMALESADF